VPQPYFPDCRETEATATPLSVPPRRLLRPWDRFFRARARASSPSRQVSPPFTRLVQPLKAAPRSGHGRLPKAPRVHACEAQPRAPHQPSGCPSGQLSLCPTSVTPLEAPLIGQDTSRISEVLRTGIGIHSQVRERRFAGLKWMLSSGDCKKLHRHPEALAASCGEPRRIGHKRLRPRSSFETRARARSSGMTASVLVVFRSACILRDIFGRRNQWPRKRESGDPYLNVRPRSQFKADRPDALHA
jgi:hypothetical protein